MGHEYREKRKYLRALAQVDILCEELKEGSGDGSGLLCFRSIDLSMGGIFIETRVPFKQGDIVHLQFALPHMDRTFKIEGKVIRVAKQAGGFSPGIGIEFVNLKDDDKKIIERFVIHENADQL